MWANVHVIPNRKYMTLDNFYAGIVSGLVTTLFVVVFRSFWLKVLIPWFEDRVYKDAHIEGTWYSLYPLTVGNRQEIVTLERHGHTVTGKMICMSDYDKGEAYYFSGSFRNMILPLVYESVDKQKTDRGTITLKLVRNAEKFSGTVAAYNTDKDIINSLQVDWYRSADEHKAALQHLEKNDALRQKANAERWAQMRENTKTKDALGSESSSPTSGSTPPVPPPAILNSSAIGDVLQKPLEIGKLPEESKPKLETGAE